MFLAYQSDENGAAAAAAALAGLGLFGVFIGLGAIVLGLVINWLIVSKAGYSGALSLLMLIPLVNVVVLLVFAFSKWPVQRELELLRSGGGFRSAGPGYAPPEAIRLPGQP